jgi:hypothetical protein
VTQATWISPPSGFLPLSLGPRRLTIDPPPQYPAAIINVTDRCGTWVTFAHAAKIPGPWDEALPPTKPYGLLADHLKRGNPAAAESR